MSSNIKISDNPIAEHNLASFMEDEVLEDSDLAYEEHISDHTGITSDELGQFIPK